MTAVPHRVLVTGGAGYVGSHACKALHAAGYEPVTYDNFSRGHRWAVKWGPVETGDIADVERIRTVLRTYRPSAVMHFAALACAGESLARPLAYYRTNVAGTVGLLEAMRTEQVHRIVYSSSCAVYGDSGPAPVAESAACRPVSPYGHGKLACERLLADCAGAWSLRPLALRYFNAAGADPAGEIGESHDPETRLIPLILRAALGRLPHVEIFGNDYPTADGFCVRDYVHVTDLADAHVRALQLLLDGGDRDRSLRVYNLGSGSGQSVKQVLDVARRVTGAEIRMALRPRRSGDPAAAVADASLARRELGWQPRFASLAEILETAWRWERRASSASGRTGD